MTFESSYEFMDKMLKMFRLDDNANTATNQRSASISANNSNLEQQKDQLCANMISEVVKVAAERVKSNQQRTASVTTPKTDEVGLLQSFISRYQQ